MWKITQHHFKIIYIELASSLQSWCAFSMGDLFDVESLIFAVGQMDAIYLKISVENIAKALKSCIGSGGSASASMFSEHSRFLAGSLKLAKIGDRSVLLFVAQDADGTVRVHHEVPVEILSKVQASALHEPLIAPPDVQLVLPLPLRPLRVLSENLKTLAQVGGSRPAAESSTLLFVSASRNGLLRFKMESATRSQLLVDVRNLATAAKVPGVTTDDASPNSAVQEAADAPFSVAIDARDFFKIMQCTQINPVHSVLCLAHEKYLLIYFYMETLQDFPATATDGSTPSVTQNHMSFYVGARSSE